MSATSEKARDAAKSKVERLIRSGKTKVDASDFSAEDAMDANVKTGMMPVSRRQYRAGGKVGGESGPSRADRKPRATGGKAPMSAVSYMNRDEKEANNERDGIHVRGGYKSGGRAHKLGGGPLMGNDNQPVASMPATTIGRKSGGRAHADEAQDRKLVTKMMHEKGCGCSRCSGGRVGRKEGGSVKGGVDASYGGTRPVSGRMARKGGGRTKGKTNINIIITQPGGQAGAPPPPMAPPPGAGPVGLHQGAPPPQMPPGASPPAAGMPMGRKAGGRAYPIDAGAGSGLGRLEKAARARP